MNLENWFVFLVFHLSEAESPKKVPGWYSANVINDGIYSPKPITEIFSTESSKSSDNPVLILQSTQSPISQDIIRTSPSTWSTNTQSTYQTYPRLDPSTIPQSTYSTLPPNNIQDVLGHRDVSGLIGTLEHLLHSQQSSPYIPTLYPTVAVTPSTIQTWLPTQSTSPPSQSLDWTSYSSTVPPLLEGEIYNPTLQLLPIIQNGAQNPRSIKPCDQAKEQPKSKTNSSSPTLQVPQAKPILTIRLKAPKGSITNLHINPSTTTTTKKPTTTRRKAVKRKSDYDTCLDSCRDKKDQICASPEGHTSIDSNTLKGFPSLCHMACHNTFRKIPSYEKVADGRCGKLRTRIRTVEKNKIKREDLKKAQYTVQNSGPETVVEFTSLKR